jgi:hypothetical protein
MAPIRIEPSARQTAGKVLPAGDSRYRPSFAHRWGIEPRSTAVYLSDPQFTGCKEYGQTSRFAGRAEIRFLSRFITYFGCSAINMPLASTLLNRKKMTFTDEWQAQ